MLSTPFSSLDQFRGLFVDGLHRLLDDDGLGAYILVLANAEFDADIMRDLRQRLHERFETHARRCRETLLQGRQLADAADDIEVFLKLMALGLERLGHRQTRNTGPWEVQFNLLRSFRPKRMSGAIAHGSQAPFEAAAFHFNKPFLRKESIWRGRLNGRHVDLLYNKFPFVDLHGLLVPERENQHPQFLTRHFHWYIWSLCSNLAADLPGTGFAYNSYGAYASVNHLHFQSFVRQQPLPIQHPRWTHNGGTLAYPASCAAFDNMDEAWCYLDHLHREEEPYNLLYFPGLLYCLPRARQGNYQPASWSGGFAWYEMAGGLVAFNKTDYEALNESMIEEELTRVSCSDD